MSTEAPPIQDKAKLAEAARFSKRMKHLRLGDMVAYWKANNRGGPDPMPAVVISKHAGNALRLRVLPFKGDTFSADGANYFKDPQFEQFPDRDANVSSWAFPDEIT